MSHWYRRPRANSVWSLLCRLQRSFLLDPSICDEVRRVLPGRIRGSVRLALDKEMLREYVIQTCQQDQCILVTADPAYETFLFQQTDVPWGLLLLPNCRNNQIEILQRLSNGQISCDFAIQLEFRVEHVRRNNLLVNLRQAPPVVRILHP